MVYSKKPERYAMFYKILIVMILFAGTLFPAYSADKKKRPEEKPAPAKKTVPKKIPPELAKIVAEIKMLNEKEAFDELERAIKTGHKTRLKVILHLHPSFLNKPDKFKRTPLYNAAYANKLKLVKYLISKKADIEKADVNGDTPLHAAAGAGYLDIVKYLLKKDASLFCANKKGESPLFKVASKGEMDVAVFLIEKGVRINGTDKSGNTPLHQAAYKGHEKMVKLLLLAGADAAKRNKKGKTPADLANKATIKKMLNKK